MLRSRTPSGAYLPCPITNRVCRRGNFHLTQHVFITDHVDPHYFVLDHREVEGDPWLPSFGPTRDRASHRGGPFVPLGRLPRIWSRRRMGRPFARAPPWRPRPRRRRVRRRGSEGKAV